MATNFPASLDSLTNPTSSDSLNSPSHSAQHANSNDAIEALQAKVGVDGSAVTTSIDYQLNTGYRYHSTVYFTSSGSFAKASYPWLRAVRVKVQGGGGGGGGCDYCSTGECAAASGATGGCYAESFITDIASLAASVTVTVGSGGAGGTGGTLAVPNGTDGTDGGDSEFGAGTAYEVSAGGGNGGRFGFDGSVLSGRDGATAKRVGTGDLVVGAGAGGDSVNAGASDATAPLAIAGNGGSSFLGGGGRGPRLRATDASSNGDDGELYGGGGGGGATTANATAQVGADGGAGANGIVIVELFA